jgi:hypothetical protein
MKTLCETLKIEFPGSKKTVTLLVSRLFAVKDLRFKTSMNLYQKKSQLVSCYDEAALSSRTAILLDSVLPCWEVCCTFHSILSISVGSVSGYGYTEKGFAVISLKVLHGPNLLTFQYINFADSLQAFFVDS